MKRILVVLWLLVMAGALPVSARIFDAGERERVTIGLIDGWEFALDAAGDAPRSVWARTLPAAAPIDLPHRWANEARTRDCAGAVWYSRILTLPERMTRSGALLVIEDTVGMVDIYFDGVPLAQFLGNGLTRRIQLTGVPGSQHRLTIRVDRQALPQEVRRVTSCGLGAISLQLLPPVRLESLQAAIDLSSETMTIRCRFFAEEASRIELNLRVFPFNSRHAVERTKKPIALDLPAGTFEQEFTLSTRKLRRWSPASPHVYRLAAEITAPGKGRDTCQVLCGSTAPAFSSDRQFLLNGTRVLMRGLRLPGGLPSSSPPSVAQALVMELADARRIGYPIKLADGLQLTEELLAIADRYGLAELLLMRRAGYNAIIADGAALSESILSLADHLGILVIAVIPPTLHDNTPQLDIRTAVEEIGHHPSVVAWSWTSVGATEAEIAALRALDPHRPLLVRTQKGSFLYSPSVSDGEEIAEFDELATAADDPAWFSLLQGAETGTLPVLVGGTALPPAVEPTLASQQSELQRLSALRRTVESVLRAQSPIGYFIRPPQGGTLTGLVTPDGAMTPACFAAMNYNSPCLIALRVVKQGKELYSDVRLINDLAQAGTYQLHRLVMTPDGLTATQWAGADREIIITGQRRHDLSEKLPPVTVTEPGEYRLQYILSSGSRVIAISQPVTIIADPRRID